ncbi:uncharacterized mitochondrial protein AtMg00300-like [Henckelia pumila]|uniref:uncharacterized mitochondrial protein AtMg00300-like n=1 Tax=Henckelia pumila TaxID=405737 RepID=UPI003C6E8153
MKILKGSLVIFKAEKLRNLYVCHAEPESCMQNFVNAVLSDKTDLWHKRLGHMSSKVLEILHKDGYFDTEKLSCVPFCDACDLEKQSRVKFPHSPSPKQYVTSEILEYLHADVWGPASVPTHGENQYFLSVIDDFSRKVWVFLLKNKYDVFEKF